MKEDTVLQKWYQNETGHCYKNIKIKQDTLLQKWYQNETGHCITKMNPSDYRLYSRGWALASSSKCRQRSLSWASASQFLQPGFLASSSTPSIHLDFGRPRPRWPPGFVHIFLVNSFSSNRPQQSTVFYCVNCIWFSLMLFWFSMLPLPPLPSLACWAIYSANDFRFEHK
jgi:hypothetical protein